MIYAFLVCLGVLVWFTLEDVLYTNSGISLGLAVEGNALIVLLFGDRPDLFQSFIGAAICDAPFIALGLAGVMAHSIALIIPGCSSMLVYAARRAKAIESWKKLGVK